MFSFLFFSLKKKSLYDAYKFLNDIHIHSAVAHGISHVVGSIEVGKVADLVAFSPAFFGSKPELILKGGIIVWGQMGKVLCFHSLSVSTRLI